VTIFFVHLISAFHALEINVPDTHFLVYFQSNIADLRLLILKHTFHFLDCGTVGQSPKKQRFVFAEGARRSANGDVVLVLVLIGIYFMLRIFRGHHINVAVILRNPPFFDESDFLDG
jgi:hypothetical protein